MRHAEVAAEQQHETGMDRFNLLRHDPKLRLFISIGPLPDRVSTSPFSPNHVAALLESF